MLKFLRLSNYDLNFRKFTIIAQIVKHSGKKIAPCSPNDKDAYQAR